MMYLTADQQIAKENLMYRLNEMLRKYSSTTYKYNEYHKTWKTERTFEQYWAEMNLLEDAIDDLYLMLTSRFELTDREKSRFNRVYTIAMNRRFAVTDTLRGWGINLSPFVAVL